MLQFFVLQIATLFRIQFLYCRCNFLLKPSKKKPVIPHSNQTENITEEFCPKHFKRKIKLIALKIILYLIKVSSFFFANLHCDKTKENTDLAINIEIFQYFLVKCTIVRFYLLTCLSSAKPCTPPEKSEDPNSYCETCERTYLLPI